MQEASCGNLWLKHGARHLSEFAPWNLPERAPPFGEFLAHAWARRWRGVWIFASVFLPLALVSAWLAPAYRATATLAVLPAPEFTVRPDAGSKDQNESALAMDQIMKAETEILGSEALHAQTIRAVGLSTLYPDLAQPGRSWLRQALRWIVSPWLGPALSGRERMEARALARFDARLRVRATKDSNVIELGFDDEDPALAARALGDLLEGYASARSRLYDDPQARVVRHETERAAAEARAAGQRLAAFKAANAIADLDQQRGLLLKRLSDARQALADARTAEASQAARLAALGAAIRQTPPSVGLYREQDTDERLQTLDDGLVALRGELAAARVHYRDTSRRVTDIEGQIAAREAERARLAADPTPSVARDGRAPDLDALQLDRAQAESDRVAAASRAASLAQQVAALRGEVATLTEKETALHDLERGRAIAEENWRTATRVLAERRLTEAEDALRLANVRVIEPARAPDRPTLLKPLLLLAGGLLGAVAAAAALLWEFLARPTFLTEAGLAEATGLPVLGVFRVAAEAEA